MLPNNIHNKSETEEGLVNINYNHNHLMLWVIQQFFTCWLQHRYVK